MRNLLLFAGVFSFVVWSCKDDFTEEDLLQQQAEINLQMQKHADSLAMAQQAHEDSMSFRRVQYTITVYNASIAAANTGGRTEGVTALEGASVSISVNGAVQTQNANANGMVVFENVPQGSVTGTVSLADFTTVQFVADLYDFSEVQDPVISAGTMIPLFETNGENMARVEGKATYEGDLLNNTKENVPDGTVVSFSINTLDQSFVNAYLDRAQTNNDIGAITSIAFEGDFTSNVVNGEYSILLPAAPQGLVYHLSFSDFMADQTIAINNYENEPANSIRDAVSIPTHFSQSGGELFVWDSYSNIPTLSATQIDIDAPPVSGSGASMTAMLYASDAGISAGAANIMVSGSGYTPDATNIPITVSNEFWDDTVTGAIEAVVLGTADAAGRLASLTVTEPGFGYRGRPTVTVGGTGSGAVVTSNYSSQVAPLHGDPGDDTGTSSGTVLTSGGSGYVLSPSVQFMGITSSDRNEIEEVATEIQNGSVVNVIQPTNFYQYAPIAIFEEIFTAQATATVSASNQGFISSIIFLTGGLGYNPLSPPQAIFRDIRGNGSGALIAFQVTTAGIISGSYNLLTHGNGFSSGNANYPGTPAAFSISTSLDNGTLIELENTVSVKPGVTRIVNAYYGTGIKERAVQ